MFKYYNPLQSRNGDVLPGYIVRLFTAGGDPVELFADESGTPIATVSGISNAAKSDDLGMVRFYAVYGTYDIRVSDPNDVFISTEPGVPMGVDLSEQVTAAEEAAAAAEAAVASAPALPQLQRLMSKLDNAKEDASVCLAGDSTGDATSEWFYLLAQALAAEYPEWTVQHALWNDVGSSYAAPTTIQTGSGSRIITFWNASVAGAVASHLASDKFALAIAATAPDCLFISYGHNGSTTGPRQLDFFDALALRCKCELPDNLVVQIGQNPTLSDETMAAKILSLSPFAARNGWGFINIHDAFKQSSIPLADLMADGVHPNAAGSALWCNIVLATLRASRSAYGGGSIVPATLIDAWVHPSDFATWTLANVTMTENTTYFETLGRSTQLACTAPGIAYMSRPLLIGDDIISYRNQWVNVNARSRVPVGNDGSSGRIDLIDSGGTTSAVGVVQGDGFIYFSCRKKVDAAATTLTAYIYVSATGGVSNTIQVDRVTFSLGMSPADYRPPATTFSRFLRVYSSSTSGIGALHNTATSDAGLRFVPSSTASPATAWTSDFRPDGIAAKQTGDTYPRAMLLDSGAWFGTGAVAPAFRIAYRLAGTVGINANWVPDANATYDNGANGVAWRDGWFTRIIYVGTSLTIAGSQVVASRKTGWAVDTGTAKRTANATYVPGATLTYGATYVQAEHTATATRLGLIEAALRDATQTIKALKDDLHGTAGHGLIGT